MTKEEMIEERNKLISIFGTAIFNRLMALNMEIQKIEQKEALSLKQKEQGTSNHE